MQENSDLHNDSHIDASETLVGKAHQLKHHCVPIVKIIGGTTFRIYRWKR